MYHKTMISSHHQCQWNISKHGKGRATAVLRTSGEGCPEIWFEIDVYEGMHTRMHSDSINIDICILTRMMHSTTNRRESATIIHALSCSQLLNNDAFFYSYQYIQYALNVALYVSIYTVALCLAGFSSRDYVLLNDKTATPSGAPPPDDDDDQHQQQCYSQ